MRKRLHKARLTVKISPQELATKIGKAEKARTLQLCVQYNTVVSSLDLSLMILQFFIDKQ